MKVFLHISILENDLFDEDDIIDLTDIENCVEYQNFNQDCISIKMIYDGRCILEILLRQR